MTLLRTVYNGFFFQAEDGIRDLVRSRGLGDVYKRQAKMVPGVARAHRVHAVDAEHGGRVHHAVAVRAFFKRRTGLRGQVTILSLIHI